MIPRIVPTSTPEPALKALFGRFLTKISPVSPPINAPMKMPQGGKNKRPMSIPITEMRTPGFEAPYFFSLHFGTRKSRAVTAHTAVPMIRRIESENGSHLYAAEIRMRAA